MLTILKGLPLSYFKDLQDDKKKVFDTYDRLKSSILITNEILNNFKINKNKMIELSNKGHITATDLADHIVRELKYPFRKAYNIVAKLVNYCDQKNKNFNDLEMHEIKKIEPKLDENAMKIFDLEYSIKSKKSYGGTSFENIKKMIKNYSKMN